MNDDQETKIPKNVKLVGVFFTFNYISPISWAIAFWSWIFAALKKKPFTDHRISHVGLIISETGQTFEALDRGLVISEFSKYRKWYYRFELYTPSKTVPKSNKAFLMQTLEDYLGDGYPFLQLLYIPIVQIKRIFGKEAINKYGRGADCVELSYLGMRPWILKGIDENSTPFRMRLALIKTKNFKLTEKKGI